MNRLRELNTKLDGKKTYLVAGATLLYAVLGYFVLNTLDQSQFINYLLAAGAVFGFRSALNK